jgi:hypothetical protein
MYLMCYYDLWLKTIIDKQNLFLCKTTAADCLMMGIYIGKVYKSEDVYIVFEML